MYLPESPPKPFTHPFGRHACWCVSVFVYQTLFSHSHHHHRRPSSPIVAHRRPSPTIQIPKWLKPPAQAPPPLEMPPKRIPCPRKLANGQYWVLAPHLNARKPSWTLWLSKSQEAARGREEKEGGRRKGQRAPQLGASTVSYVHQPTNFPPLVDGKTSAALAAEVASADVGGPPDHLTP